MRNFAKFLKMLLLGKVIVFLAHFPDEENRKDGYYQRIFAVDDYLSQYFRIYLNFVESYEVNSRIFPKILNVKKSVYQIDSSNRKRTHQLFVAVLIILAGKVYSHSILKLHSEFDRFLFSLARKRVLDLHGSVPEEFQLQGDDSGFSMFSPIEKFAVNKANILIGVTRKMVDHVSNKYAIRKNKKIIVLPILPEAKDVFDNAKDFKGMSVIYCGGLQKWQQIDKMLSYVHQNKDIIKFAFLVPDPICLMAMYKDRYGEVLPGIVQSVEANKVSEWYKEYSFGFVLREDIVVNNVACPTKLIEYLQNDVVPIVDSNNIGDFKQLGYGYISYLDKLPEKDVWENMILRNREVLDKIYKIFKDGADLLSKSI